MKFDGSLVCKLIFIKSGYNQTDEAVTMRRLLRPYQFRYKVSSFLKQVSITLNEHIQIATETR